MLPRLFPGRMPLALVFTLALNLSAHATDAAVSPAGCAGASEIIAADCPLTWHAIARFLNAPLRTGLRLWAKATMTVNCHSGFNGTCVDQVFRGALRAPATDPMLADELGGLSSAGIRGAWAVTRDEASPYAGLHWSGRLEDPVGIVHSAVTSGLVTAVPSKPSFAFDSDNPATSLGVRFAF